MPATSPPRLVVVAAGSCIEIVRGGARLSLVGEEARRIAAAHARLTTISEQAAEAYLIGLLEGVTDLRVASFGADVCSQAVSVRCV